MSPTKKCEQCNKEPVATREWGPGLCARCAAMTARGDGGER